VTGYLIDLAIGIIFFLYGARLSREAVIGGMTHWRLHLLAFASTCVLFPVLGLALSHWRPARRTAAPSTFPEKSRMEGRNNLVVRQIIFLGSNK
jgi:predicted Na+-dependent transporter